MAWREILVSPAPFLRSQKCILDLGVLVKYRSNLKVVVQHPFGDLILPNVALICFRFLKRATSGLEVCWVLVSLHLTHFWRFVDVLRTWKFCESDPTVRESSISSDVPIIVKAALLQIVQVYLCLPICVDALQWDRER